MKIKKKYFCFFIVCITLDASLQGSSQIDSLKNCLKTTQADTAKVITYNTLSSILLHENVAESFIYAFKGLALSKQINYEIGVSESYKMLGNLHGFNSGDSDLYYLNKSLDLKLKLNDLKGVAALYINIGTAYDKASDSKLALKNYLSGLKLFELLKIDKGIAGAALGAGNVFLEIKDYKKAIDYYQKSIDGYKKINSPYLSWAINNLANVYDKLNDNKKAISLYEESLKLKLALNDFYGAVFSINDIGLILSKEGKQKDALVFFFKGLTINREHQLEKEPFANSYKSISQTLMLMNDNGKAKLYLDSFVVIANQLNSSDMKMECLDLKSKYYENIGDYKNALLFKSKYLILKDSLFTTDMNKQVAEADAKYKIEKKQKEIGLLNKDNVIQQTKIDKQQTQRNIFIIGVLALMGLVVFVFINLKKQRQANKIISLQKQSVETKNHIIEETQKEILDSIRYAKRIQTVLLANKQLVTSYIPNNFILFNPKDIVSGDFYWATEHNHKFYLAICDSTGHGVPGAFMSLLNMGFLNEAIKEKNIAEPGNIFNYVRERLIASISTEGQQDGMDGILLCIESPSPLERDGRVRITYSAANNEPILISKDKILELPKDKMPVGKGEKIDSFKTHVITANKGDMLYLYTDGYADQFGGPKGKKFKYKPLNELLLSLSQAPMETQKEKLTLILEDWKGNLEQVDDILIVGIKL